jgi:hypothetical protein
VVTGLMEANSAARRAKGARHILLVFLSFGVFEGVPREMALIPTGSETPQRHYPRECKSGEITLLKGFNPPRPRHAFRARAFSRATTLLTTLSSPSPSLPPAGQPLQKALIHHP